MRFSTIVLAGSFVTTSVATTYHLMETVPACDRELIVGIGSNKLFEYVLTHCIADSSSPKLTVAGDADPGAEGCLINFIASTPMSLPIPPSGACRESIQRVVTDVIANAAFNLLSFDSLTGQLGMDSTLFSSSATLTAALSTFQEASELSIAYPSCSGAMVRAMSVNLAYETLVKGAANAAPVAYGLSVSDVICDHCYRLFDAVLKGTNGVASDLILKALCLADPHDAICKNSTAVQRAMYYFRNCAGYDIEFMGPVCTAEQLAPIQQMNPHPYIPLMMCKFDTDSFSDVCSDVEGYIAELSTVSGSTDCGGCFTSFYDNILVTDATKSACAGGNYATPICIASQQSAHIKFQACSGSFMTIPK
jgi:hypothetical protein